MGSNLVNFNKVTEQATDERFVPCPKCFAQCAPSMAIAIKHGMNPVKTVHIQRTDCGLCLGERRVKEMAATVYRLAGQEGVKDLAESE